MGKKHLIILGNGFTMDLLKAINKKDIINLKNLFSFGDKVPWPENNIPGFLSYKHTPNLWEIGVNSTIDNENALELIENIITTVNMYSEINRINNRIDPEYLAKIKDSRYLKGYRELSSYLKQLFIYYNSLINDEYLNRNTIKNWGWYKYFNNLNNNKDIEEVIIISYNYDIFLERVLQSMEIDFCVEGLENKTCKFKIIKPHGSISFVHKTTLPYYSIKYDPILPEGNIEDFKLKYCDLVQYCLTDAIIPPAGNSNRINVQWASQLRKIVLKHAQQIAFNDNIVISGLSYWEVDREEIDELLVNIHPGANVIMVNPCMPKTFSAVIESIFKNYFLYTDSNNLGRIEE